jgi:DUF1009 family protein
MMMKNKIMFERYLGNLVDRIYKILPLYEEQNEGLFKYIQSLVFELNGFHYVVNNGLSYHYLSLMATLESLSDESLLSDKENKEEVKREVFKCIDITKKIKKHSIGQSSDK